MSCAKGSKSDSGAEKRRRKRNAEAFIASQKGAIFKHFKSSVQEKEKSPAIPATENYEEKDEAIQHEHATIQ